MFHLVNPLTSPQGFSHSSPLLNFIVDRYLVNALCIAASLFHHGYLVAKSPQLGCFPVDINFSLYFATSLQRFCILPLLPYFTVEISSIWWAFPFYVHGEADLQISMVNVQGIY